MKFKYYLKVKGLETPHQVPDRHFEVPDGALEGLELADREEIIRHFMLQDAREVFSFDFRDSSTDREK